MAYSLRFSCIQSATYDFSTLYTILHYNLIKDKIVDIIERTFQRKDTLYIACNDRNAFFTSDAVRNYNLLDLELEIDPLPPGGSFVHYNFLKQHYIRNKMTHVSSLYVGALTCNVNVSYTT